MQRSVSSGQTGILLVNLGTPDRPDRASVGRYLAEFLMDRRVIELPWIFRLLLVRGIIVNFRAHRSAAAYRKIWTEEGSPLLVYSNALAQGLGQKLGPGFQVEVAMRYGAPSINDVIDKLLAAECENLIVVPLYPQYSGSTSGSVFDAVAEVLMKRRRVPQFQFIDAYYQRPEYIESIAASIEAHWQKNGRGEKLVMSFHGVPQKYVKRGDPYQHQCEASANAIAKRLGLDPSDWLLVYQSRFGAEPWLQPYCDKTLEALPSEGVKSIDIICPGFSVDCLETLEEIQMENKELFLEAGGEQFHYVACLNDSEDHIRVMQSVVNSALNQLSGAPGVASSSARD